MLPGLGCCELILCYRRLKDNFSIIRAEDRPKLLQAKEEVEVEVQKLKWQLIRDKVKQKGGDANYTVSYTSHISKEQKSG